MSITDNDNNQMYTPTTGLQIGASDYTPEVTTYESI